MSQIFKSAFLVVGVGLFLTSCKGDDENECCDPSNPECANYDACFGKLETTAFFTISQALSNFGDNNSVFIEYDVITGGTLKFSAIPQEGATYTWILGVDTTIGGPEITTTIGTLSNGSYPNTLIVTKTLDTNHLVLDPLPCPSNNIQGIFFVNANMIGDTIMMDLDGAVNRILSFKAYGFIDLPEGTAALDINSNVLEAEYSIDDTNYLFTGRKL